VGWPLSTAGRSDRNCFIEIEESAGTFVAGERIKQAIVIDVGPHFGL
jgi:hypothetical protein